ncbi:nectin-2-like isoform X1 [Polypterus senegalus]|uniref:nectin-2-like isoform X1 n=2 Tax=Polypterus senegalus TaxID=55291 RepID=UPI001962D345|nr:nectin-2-like isoform X1 [Polypterus senegalus]
MKLLPLILLVFLGSLGPCLALNVFAPLHQVTVMLYSDALLPCSFTPSSPDKGLKFILLAWTHKELKLPGFKFGRLKNTDKAMMSESELQEYNASLLLKHVTIKDEGEYTCQVSETILETKAVSVWLKVIAQPKMFLKPSMIIMDQPGTVECHVKGIYPRNFTIEWVIDSQPSSYQEPLKLEEDEDQTFSTVSSYQYSPPTNDLPVNVSCLVKHESLEGGLKEIPLQICKPNLTTKTYINGTKWQVICEVNGCIFSGVTVRLKKKNTTLNGSECHDVAVCVTETVIGKNTSEEEEELICEMEFEGIDMPFTKNITLTDQGAMMSFGVIDGIAIGSILVLLLALITLYRYKECLKNVFSSCDCTNGTRLEDVSVDKGCNGENIELHDQPKKPTRPIHDNGQEERTQLLTLPPPLR